MNLSAAAALPLDKGVAQAAPRVAVLAVAQARGAATSVVEVPEAWRKMRRSRWVQRWHCHWCTKERDGSLGFVISDKPGLEHDVGRRCARLTERHCERQSWRHDMKSKQAYKLMQPASKHLVKGYVVKVPLSVSGLSSITPPRDAFCCHQQRSSGP